jgi:hypothetical protein
LNRDELEALREGWDFEAKLAAGRDGRSALPESVWERTARWRTPKAGSSSWVLKLRVRQAVAGDILGTPRSGRAREVPLSPDTLKALNAQPQPGFRPARRTRMS